MSRRNPREQVRVVEASRDNATPDGWRFTVADIRAMPPDGNRYELIDGILLVTPARGMVEIESFLQGGFLDAMTESFEAAGATVIPGRPSRDPFLRLDPDNPPSDPEVFLFRREHLTGMGSPGDGSRHQLVDGRVLRLPVDDEGRQEIVDRVLDRWRQAGAAGEADPDLRIGDRAVTLEIDDRTELTPDLAVVPTGPNVGELAVPSVVIDMTYEWSLMRPDYDQLRDAYARAGVAEYWLIDREFDEVIIHRHPRGHTYGKIDRHPRDITAEAAYVPGLAFSYADVMPRA